MSKPTIIIADDNPSHLRLMEMMLTSEAHEVITAEDGIEVLEYLKHHTPELIILDIEMPYLTGLELCARIKGVARLASVPVISRIARVRSSTTSALKLRPAIRRSQCP